MRVCEENFVIEGEGKFCGQPTYFIRTTGCNLRCSWKNEDGTTTICDTPYTSFNPEKGYDLDVDKVIKLLKEKNITKRITITGGEPTLQPDLVSVCDRFLVAGFNVTIETNGIKYIEGLLPEVFISCSPKLKSSYFQEYDSERLMHSGNNVFRSTVSKWCDYFTCQVKFVVNTEDDLKEIKEIQKDLGIPPEFIWLMPQGITREQLDEKSKWLTKICLENGYNYSQRLHIIVFGNERGK